MRDSADLAALTFVTKRPDGTFNLWTPERPADYAAGCAMGRDYAAELLAHIKASGNPSIFGSVGRAITHAGDWGAVETGFFAIIGIHLMGISNQITVKDVAVPMVNAG